MLVLLTCACLSFCAGLTNSSSHPIRHTRYGNSTLNDTTASNETSSIYTALPASASHPVSLTQQRNTSISISISSSRPRILSYNATSSTSAASSTNTTWSIRATLSAGVGSSRSGYNSGNATFTRSALSSSDFSSWNTTISHNVTNAPANCSFSVQRPSTNHTFPYIIPYDTPQACNIYGPACQIGSITVGVSLKGCRSSMTTMPCSDYLSSQRSYLKAFSTTADPHALALNAEGPGVIPVIRPPAHDGALPSDWNLNFGRSPECRAYAQREEQGGQWNFDGCPAGENVEPVRMPPVTSMNFNQQPAWGSTCDRQFSAWALLPTQLPPGIIQYKADYNCQTCCGNCTLDVPEFRLYYFEDENADEYCASKGRRVLGSDLIANATKRGNFSGPGNSYGLASQSFGSVNYNSSLSNKTLPRIVTSTSLRGSIVTTRGHTLTSPSVYLEVVGTMAVHDQCGPLGQNKTGVFIAVPPGQLSTSKVDLIPHIRDVGSQWLDPSVYGQGFFAPGNVQPFVAADMNCPTFGLGVSTNDQGLVRTTIGSPWLPLIVPPSQALSLDTAWLKYCTGILSYSQNLASFGVFDPPHALVPDSAGGMVAPSESQPTPAADPEQTRIQPGQLPTAATPSATSLFDAPTHNLMFAPIAKIPAAGLLPKWSKTSQAASSQASEAAPASRQDTIPQGSAQSVKNPSDNGLAAGDRLGNPSSLAGQQASTPLNNAVNPGNSPSDTAGNGSQPEDPSNPQQAAGTVQGSGGTGLSNSNDNGVNAQQTHDPANIPIMNPSGEANGANSVLQVAGPHSTPSKNGDGAGSQAGMKGVSPAGSPINDEGSNPDVSPAQQGSQGVKQPTEGGQAGSQGTTPEGSNGQGAASESSSNKGTIQQGSGDQVTSPQKGDNNQVDSPSGMEGGPPAGNPIIGAGSDPDVSSVQQGNQGMNQPIEGAQAGPQSSTPQGSNSQGGVPQSLNNKETTPQASNNQASSPQNGENNQVVPPSGVEKGSSASNPANGQGSDQIEQPTQQVNQDAGQQDPGAEANAQGITPQVTNGNEPLPQGSSSKESIQQASDGQVMTPQDSLGSNGAPQLGEQGIQFSNADDLPRTTQAVTIAGQTYHPDSTGFEVAGQAVEPGIPGVVVSGTPVSLAPSGTLMIGGSAIPILKPAPQVQPLRVGGESFIPKPEGFNVGGKDVQPGGPAVVIAGTSLSLAPSGVLHLGGSTIQLVQAVPTPAARNWQLLKVGGQSFVPNPTGFVVAGQSVKAGGPAVNIAGTPISLAQNSALYVGSSSIHLDSADLGPVTSAIPWNVVNIGGESVDAFPTGFAIPGGSIIIPGAAPVTVASTPVSLGSDGILHVGTSAIPLLPPGRQLNEQNASTFNVGNFTFTPVTPSATAVSVEGTAILPNSPPQTIHGTNISLANDGLFVNGTRITIPKGANNVFNVGNLAFAATTPPAGVSVDGIRILPGETALNLRGKNITVNAGGGLAIGDTAMPIPRYSSDGSVLQVGNLTFSALSRGGGVMVDGTTILPNATAKMVHAVSVKLDASGNLVAGNVSMAAPTRLAATTTGSGNMVETTGFAAPSGGIITDNARTSTSAAVIGSSGGGGPTGASTGDGRLDDGNAASALQLSWLWMVVALLFGSSGFFFL